jgi:hypothetical protein
MRLASKTAAEADEDRSATSHFSTREVSTVSIGPARVRPPRRRSAHCPKGLEAQAGWAGAAAILSYGRGPNDNDPRMPALDDVSSFRGRQ